MYSVPRGSVLPRRALLTAAGAVGLTAAACDITSTDPAGDQAQDGAPQHKEAPALRRLVDQGQLPALAERLPDDPMVVEPVDRAGTYGGTLRSFTSGPSNMIELYPWVAYENLVRWTIDWTGATGAEELTANLAASFEVNDDATELTFHLRPGMRWSDGKPFTVDDIVFAVNDVLLNEELNPAPPSMLAPSGEPARLEQIDDASFRLIFPEPAGLFLQELASPGGHDLTRYPRHYLEQFHADYNSDVDSLVDEEGFEDWIELFGSKAPRWPGEQVDIPTLGPWILVTPYGEGTQVVFERNPYYWKVDSNGRQLPYIDRIEFSVINDLEATLLRTLNGDVDLSAFPSPTINIAQNKPILAASRQEGQYRFVDVAPTHMNVMNIHLNQTHQDPTRREVFQNKDFRIALSHAINRQELIDATLQRQGEPYQAAPLPDSPFYNEELASQYLTYDLDLANSILDENYPDTNSQGTRLDPEGNPISIQISFVSEQSATWNSMLELIQDYWGDVGINVQLEPLDRSLWSVRRDSNEHDAGVWLGGGGLDVILNPWNYFPDRAGSIYAVQWGIWYSSGGAEGEEPQAQGRRQMELYDQLRVTAEPDEQTRLMSEILSIAKDMFYIIGLARETQEYFVVSNRLLNIPDTMLRGWTYPTPGPTQPEQYFLNDD